MQWFMWRVQHSRLWLTVGPFVSRPFDLFLLVLEDGVQVGAQLVQGGAHVGAAKAQPEVVSAGLVVARAGQQKHACTYRAHEGGDERPTNDHRLLLEEEEEEWGTLLDDQVFTEHLYERAWLAISRLGLAGRYRFEIRLELGHEVKPRETCGAARWSHLSHPHVRPGAHQRPSAVAKRTVRTQERTDENSVKKTSRRARLR